MFNYIHSIIAGVLISIATYVSPIKQISPTPPPKISISITLIVPTTVYKSSKPPRLLMFKYGEMVITPALMMGMNNTGIDRIAFGAVKELEDLYNL